MNYRKILIIENLLLVIILSIFVVLAIRKSREADDLVLQYKAEAERQTEIAVEQATLARQAQAEAIMMQERAEEQQQAARRAMEDCEGGN